MAISSSLPPAVDNEGEQTLVCERAGVQKSRAHVTVATVRGGGWAWTRVWHVRVAVSSRRDLDLEVGVLSLVKQSDPTCFTRFREDSDMYVGNRAGVPYLVALQKWGVCHIWFAYLNMNSKTKSQSPVHPEAVCHWFLG